jgi:hypothetical protein
MPAPSQQSRYNSDCGKVVATSAASRNANTTQRKRFRNLLIRNFEHWIVHFDVSTKHFQERRFDGANAAEVEHPQIGAVLPEDLRKIVAQIPQAMIGPVHPNQIVDDSLIELREVVAQTGRDHLNAKQSGAVSKQNRTIGTNLGMVEPSDIEFLQLRTCPSPGLKPGGGR